MDEILGIHLGPNSSSLLVRLLLLIKMFILMALGNTT